MIQTVAGRTGLCVAGAWTSWMFRVQKNPLLWIYRVKYTLHWHVWSILLCRSSTRKGVEKHLQYICMLIPLRCCCEVSFSQLTCIQYTTCSWQFEACFKQIYCNKSFVYKRLLLGFRIRESSCSCRSTQDPLSPPELGGEFVSWIQFQLLRSCMWVDHVFRCMQLLTDMPDACSCREC